ncbi:MAG TPA: hypothetical protein VGK29_02180 [Paludibaculum sp.]|jgi:hypothetical protein
MLLTLSVVAFLLAPPLPELRTEATAGGSVFHVRNGGTQPLTGYFIELVNYPGSSYMLFQDELSGAPLAAGATREIPVVNMTVGAVPEYVKMQAALYADGSTVGSAEKVAQMMERRRHMLATVRELIGRLEKTPPATADELKLWADSIPAPTRANRNTQAAINNVAAQGVIRDVAAKVDGALMRLRAAERALRD